MNRANRDDLGSRDEGLSAEFHVAGVDGGVVGGAIFLGLLRRLTLFVDAIAWRRTVLGALVDGGEVDARQLAKLNDGLAGKAFAGLGALGVYLTLFGAVGAAAVGAGTERLGTIVERDVPDEVVGAWLDLNPLQDEVGVGVARRANFGLAGGAHQDAKDQESGGEQRETHVLSIPWPKPFGVAPVRS